MPFKETEIEGLWVFEPKIFTDERGFFFESFNLKEFSDKTGITRSFVQHNHSRSKYGVLRGLHFQKEPHSQAKLVRVLKGKVWDVAVDIRPNSSTYGQHFGIELSDENYKQLYVPRGFAHGFIVLSESADFSYLCDNYYAPKFESGIIFNDADLAINWQIPESEIIISSKDSLLTRFK